MTKFTYKNEGGRKWDVGSGTRPTQTKFKKKKNLTINIPVIFMARYVIVLWGATSLRGALEGVGPENRDFFGP